MPVEIAIEHLRSMFAEYRVASYKDLGDIYVFEAYSPVFDVMEEPKVSMDPWYYVDKKTGNTGHYYPFRFNPKRFFETEKMNI